MTAGKIHDHLSEGEQFLRRHGAGLKGQEVHLQGALQAVQEGGGGGRQLWGRSLTHVRQEQGGPVRLAAAGPQVHREQLLRPRDAEGGEVVQHGDGRHRVLHRGLIEQMSLK